MTNGGIAPIRSTRRVQDVIRLRNEGEKKINEKIENVRKVR